MTITGKMSRLFGRTLRKSKVVSQSKRIKFLYNGNIKKKIIIRISNEGCHCFALNFNPLFYRRYECKRLFRVLLVFKIFRRKCTFKLPLSSSYQFTIKTKIGEKPMH